MTEIDISRGSGRISQWHPPASIAPQPQSAITPASFMQGMAELQQAMQANTLALAEFQRQQQQAALAPYQPSPSPAPYHPPAHPVQWSQPQPWQPPQWTPPAPQAPQLHTTISPIIRIDASSHSAQDNGGGNWFGLLLGLGFCFALGTAALGGN